MTSPSLDGPWRVASEPPKGAAEAEKQAMASPTPVDLLDGQTGRAHQQTSLAHQRDRARSFMSRRSPTELILFDGQPNFLPIARTHLVYVANTTGNVFKLLTDQQTYVLISGRWFRAPSLDGPWQFVPADHLPPDFAKIPDTSPKENVKASVPGTEQATEALIANSIPESTKVPRNTQMQNPQIDGPPSLQPIPGTPLHYVANSGTPIIEVNQQSWYACQNGVWYAAPSVNGPWTVATSVPSVIYTIPPSSPLHYLTYVQVYGATPEFVYEGYTPGYWGTEVEDGVVVYGTGYDYPPWVGDGWYGWPCTWGFGWGPVGHPGTIGVSITDLAGVAALADSTRRAATRRGPGGDPTGTGSVRAASRLEAGVTRQAQQATFTPGNPRGGAGTGQMTGTARSGRLRSRIQLAHGRLGCRPTCKRAECLCRAPLCNVRRRLGRRI